MYFNQNNNSVGMPWEQPNRILQQMAAAHAANIRRNIEKKPSFSLNQSHVPEQVIHHPASDFSGNMQGNQVDEAQASALLTLLGMGGQSSEQHGQQQPPMAVAPAQPREPSPLFASPAAPKKKETKAPKKRASPKKSIAKNVPVVSGWENCDNVKNTPIVSSWENCEIPGLISPSNTGVQSPSPPTNSISYNHEDIIGKMKATTDADFFSQQFEFPLSATPEIPGASVVSSTPASSSTVAPKRANRKRKIDTVVKTDNDQTSVPESPMKKAAPKRARGKAKAKAEPPVEVKQEENPAPPIAAPEEITPPKINLKDMIGAAVTVKGKGNKKPIVKEEIISDKDS
jgi:hypothetical protein